MKTTRLRILAILCLFATIACNNPKTYTLKAGDTSHLPLDSLLTPKDSAIASMTFYDSLSKKEFGEVPIKAYTIRSQDLLAAMGLDSSLLNQAIYKHIRVYLGYDINEKKRRAKGFRLFVVPVEGANLDTFPQIGGIDVMLKRNGRGITMGEIKSISDDEQFVLDLNAPCPNTCAENGSLLTKKP